MSTLNFIYLAGFLGVFIWGFWCACLDKQRSWRRDLVLACGVTFWALIWPITIVTSITMGLLLMRADRRRD